MPGYEFAEALVVLPGMYCAIPPPLRGTSLYTREAWALPRQCDKLQFKTINRLVTTCGEERIARIALQFPAGYAKMI